MSIRQRELDTEMIWRTLGGRLRQFIRSRVTSDADADDVLQTVFLRIHRNLEQLRARDRLEPWVFQIARNAVTDHFRGKAFESLAAESVISPPEEKPRNLNADVAGCLDSLIDHLPEHLRHAVSLYERKGLSQQEIATRVGITLSGAKSRIQRGRRALKQLLEACCQFELDRRGNVLEMQRAGTSPCRSCLSP